MKNNRRLGVLAWCLIVLLLLGTLPCAAESNEREPDKIAQAYLDGILSSQGAADVQAWINGALCQNAGVGAEWYILALAQYGDYHFSSYESALLAYLDENTVGSASSRLKYALCLAAIGSTDSYISKTLNDSIGEQGLMSWVFGLHLLQNGYRSDRYTAADVIANLLALQCEDGGWAIMGQNSDVDATAMTLQALAPYYADDPTVRSCVDRAILRLSQMQLDGGDYAAFGVSNPESVAQVLMAISALGIDVSDARFGKNGNSLFDGLEKYRLLSGGFCHVAGGAENGAATSQVLCAMVSYLRMRDGKTSLYVLDRADPTHVMPAPTAPNDTEGESDRETVEQNGPAGEGTPRGRYQPWAALIVLGLGGIACMLLFFLRKRHIKNFIAVLLVCAVAITVIYTTDFRSADDYYNGENVTKENAIGKVTLSIRCDTVAGKAPHIPTDGIILDSTELEIAEGDSVYTVLTDAARKYRLQIENNGNSTYAYIAGINYLYELDFGDLSGWTYTVNGTRTSVGAGEYRLSDGDVIVWYYTTSLGEDVP